MYRRARGILFTAALTVVSQISVAQAVVQPTPAPLVTAENEPWFRAGSAIEWSGELFYPTGAPRAFDPSTMASAGSYHGIPLYTDIAQSDGIVLVPISAGRVQPYAPLHTGTPLDTAGCVPAALHADAASPLVASAVVGTTGRTTPTVVAGPVESAIPPKGVNNAFIEYEGRRWLADGRATALTPDMQPAGSYHGFTVYTRGTDRATIYIPSSMDLVVPFTRR